MSELSNGNLESPLRTGPQKANPGASLQEQTGQTQNLEGNQEEAEEVTSSGRSPDRPEA